MNDINKMPPKCQYCPYWEVCKYPWVCPDIGDKKPKRTEERTETHACDCISRAAAIDAIRASTQKYTGFMEMEMYTDDDAVEAIINLPSAQPKSYREGYQAGFKDAQSERKRGTWIYGEDEYGIDGYHCDKCGFFVPWDYTHKFIGFIKDYHFCPNCGADMREVDDERPDLQTGSD